MCVAAGAAKNSTVADSVAQARRNELAHQVLESGGIKMKLQTQRRIELTRLSTLCSAFWLLTLATACSSHSIIRTTKDASVTIAVAKEVLTTMPSENQIAEINNPEVRAVAALTRQSVTDLASAPSSNVSAIATQFGTFTVLGARLDEASGPRTCTFQCRADRDECLDDCKKFCGCRILAAGCLISAWAHGKC